MASRSSASGLGEPLGDKLVPDLADLLKIVHALVGVLFVAGLVIWKPF